MSDHLSDIVFQEVIAERDALRQELAEAAEREKVNARAFLAQIDLRRAAEAELASSEAQVDGAELRCMAAETEVKRLQEISDSMTGPAKIVELRADNARLREALRDLLPWAGKQTSVNDAVWVNARAALADKEET